MEAGNEGNGGSRELEGVVETRNGDAIIVLLVPRSHRPPLSVRQDLRGARCKSVKKWWANIYFLT